MKKQIRVIVIGASAGGVEALNTLFQRLQPSENTAFFIVVHIPSHFKSNLPKILSRHSPIPVEHADDRQPIRPGQAYVAPPNRHMVLQDGRIWLEFGPKEISSRPAIDPLFRTAAQAYGDQVIGVVLSGNLHDGTHGLQAIKQAGGITIAQDPEEALYPSMPSSAIATQAVDYILPVAEIAELLNNLMSQDLSLGEKPMSEELPDYSPDETALIRDEIKNYEHGLAKNQRSVISCPDCGGVLWELDDDNMLRFRCHVGHVYDPETLLGSKDETVEAAFWSAVRALVEKASLSNRLALRAESRGQQALKDFYLERAREAEREADLIRKTWFRGAAGRSMGKSAGEQANRDVSGEIS